jgi:molybdate transport system ATP-binding protein
MNVLRFDCRFHYENRFALDFSFEATAGVTALIGPSGSGKTTVLNLIAGLLRPHDGLIMLGEHTLFNSQQAVDVAPHRRNIGYVFQDYQLFPHLTVEQNLLYGHSRTDKQTVELERVVETLELGHFLKRFPATLSGGQKQRVAVGRALLSSPRLLLLDEPLNALDARLRESVVIYLKKVIDQFAIPTILVSHEQSHLAPLQADGLATVLLPQAM